VIDGRGGFPLGPIASHKKELPRRETTYIGNKTPRTVFGKYAYVRGVLPTSLWHLEKKVLQTGALGNYRFCKRLMITDVGVQ
jgi:hypothetical protein